MPSRKVNLMAQTIEERLAAAKQVAQDAEKKRIQLETKLESAQAKKQELLDKCKQLNVTPEELPEKIKALEEQIAAGMKELEGLLPSTETPSNDDMPF